MSDPIIYGPAYSTYSRSVRLALEEKGVPYKLEPVDIIQGAANAADHLSRRSALDRAGGPLSPDLSPRMRQPGTVHAA